jgi:hypothetical protein
MAIEKECPECGQLAISDADGYHPLEYDEGADVSEGRIEWALVAHCREFIAKQGITCAETIYQVDRVMENAAEFIEGVCEIVGYAPRDDA